MPSTRYAKVAGPCPNPRCTAMVTKTSGLTSDETRGLPRINEGKQNCTRCARTGTPSRRADDFQWTPATLQNAVAYAMKKLYDDVA